MANETIRARIEVLVRGMDQVESLKNATRQLQTTAAPAAADLQKLKSAAMQLGSASDRTENDLRRSINALKDVRAQLSLADVDYRRLTGTINKYQSQLDKATGSQQKAGRGMQFAQTAGAVAASGVFGGPEGLVGAGIGAFFGPGGALAGGAIGAQVGMFRQQLGATTTLAADLEKQRIALKLVLKDTAEYNSALEFLSKTSRDYAIPQDRLLKGFTQLAASVAGAGGNINDTKTAFEGITAGIRGTGGSLENLDGALLATAQVFSKGKVSAEELRGQIGERLPGAFTLFAEAIGKTPQELDKALERGEVGLQDFLKFSTTIFGEYGENAKIIADSPAAAGDRLQTNLKNLSESVGRLLQPIGASFQNTFSEIIKYIDGAARRLADFLGLNRSNAEKIGQLNNQIIVQQRGIQRERDKLASGQTSKEAAEYSIKEFEARIARFQAEAKTLKAFEKAASEQQKETRKGLADAGGGTSAADAKAAEKAAKDAEAQAQRLATEEQRLNELLARNAIQLDDERFRHRQELIRKEFEYQQELAQRQNQLWASDFVGLGAQSARAIADLFGKLDGYRRAELDAQSGVAAAQQGLRSAQSLEGVTSQGLPGGGAGGGQLGKLSSQGRALVAAAQKLGVSPLDLATIIGFETGGTYSPSKRGGAGGNYMGLIQFGQNERKAYGANPGQSFEEQVTGPVVRYFKDRFKGVGMSTQGADLLTLYRTVLGGNPKASLTARDAFGTSPQSGVGKMAPHRSEALRRFFGGDVANVPMGGAGMAGQVRRDVSAEGQVAVSQAQLLQQQKLAAFEKKRIETLKGFDFAEFNQQLTRGLVEQNLALESGIADLQLRNQLEAQGMRPELVEAEMGKARLYREQEQLLEPLREALTVVDDPAAKERIAESIAGINGLYSEQIALIERQAQAQTAQGAALTAYVGQLKLQLAELTNIENVLISVGQTVESEISSAMSTAISSVVTGSGTVKQAMSDMLRNIGQSFVQMATQIIAKQLVMIVLGTIMKALGVGMPGGGGGGNAATALGSNPNVAAYAPLADGGVFGGGVKPFAKGGIVSRPTFFKFANGGTMQNGVMGEAGPEAIVPLKRGADGKLGIAQMPAPQGGDSRMRDMMGRSPAAAAPPVLNMSFQTTSIGGVEYVSREQLEQAMAQTRRQASKDGARQGMSMTLDRLQQSPSTRSRVGIR